MPEHTHQWFEINKVSRNEEYLGVAVMCADCDVMKLLCKNGLSVFPYYPKVEDN